MSAGTEESDSGRLRHPGSEPVHLDMLRTRKKAGRAVLVSACLAGRRCRYDGGDRRNEFVARMVEAGEAIPICPELFIGLPIPRPPAEIVGGDGSDVLAGRARVVQRTGADVTEQFIKGANKVLAVAADARATKAILKSKSPSCGPDEIHDGTFTGVLRGGMGVAAALLAQNGIVVESSNDYSAED